jgi:hypothetical protein
LGKANKIYHKFTQTCQLWEKERLQSSSFSILPQLKTLDAFDKIQDDSREKLPNRNKKTA